MHLRRSAAFCFPGDMRGGKTLCKRKSHNNAIFKNAEVVLAETECSPKDIILRANGVSVQESADFVETLSKPFFEAYFFLILL